MKGFIEVNAAYIGVISLNILKIKTFRPLEQNRCAIEMENKDTEVTKESYEEIKRKIEEAQK